MKRVLVTGANGFIGKHVIEPLSLRGFEIHCTSTKDLGQSSIDNNCFFHQVNLLDTMQVEKLIEKVKPAFLLHLAWDVTHGEFWNSHKNIEWLQSSIKLLESFIRYGGKRVVMVGTCAEYDLHHGYCIETETPSKPESLYGLCKLSLQQFLEGYSRLSGVSSSWGRIFFCYGPHENNKRLVPTVINSLLNNQIANCTHGTQVRDFLFVQDIANALVQLLDSEVNGVVNIASGKGIEVKELVEKISVLLNKPDLIRFGAIPTSENESKLIVADTTRLKSEVGFDSFLSIDEGLEMTVNWWGNYLTRGK